MAVFSMISHLDLMVILCMYKTFEHYLFSNKVRCITELDSVFFLSVSIRFYLQSHRLMLGVTKLRQITITLYDQTSMWTTKCMKYNVSQQIRGITVVKILFLYYIQHIFMSQAGPHTLPNYLYKALMLACCYISDLFDVILKFNMCNVLW